MPIRANSRFSNPDAARKYLERIFWPEGAVCAHCGVMGQATLLKGKSTRPGVYWCNACGKPFTVTVGTVFENSKVPLNSWLYLNHLLCSTMKRVSVLRSAQMLGVTYKTAWFMTRHIRGAMASTALPPVPAKQRLKKAAVSKATP